MKKNLLMIALIAVVSSCYKKDIESLQSQIDNLKSGEIASINQQIGAINNSISNLKDVDEELKDYITTLEKQASKLKSADEKLSEDISHVEKSLKAEDDAIILSLEEYKATVAGQMATINNTLNELKEKDSVIEKKITALTEMIDSELKNTTDWVTGTFATLAQHDSLCTEVTGIKARIEELQNNLSQTNQNLESAKQELEQSISTLDSQIQQQISTVIENTNAKIAETAVTLTEAYESHVKAKILELESSLKAWVNEQLDDYYTISETESRLLAVQTTLNDKLDAQKLYYDSAISLLSTTLSTRLDADEALISKIQSNIAELQKKDLELSEAIADNTEAIENVKTELALAKVQIKEAYEKAISEAIETYNGVIVKKISDDIAAASKALQDQIDGINTTIESIESRVGSLEDRVDALEADVVIKAIQSVTYIPRYADSKSTMWFWQTGDDSTLGDTDTLDFVILPSGKASEIVNTKDVTLTANAVYNALTRANSSSFVNLNVISKEANGDVLTVVVDGKPLSNDFYFGKMGASIRVSIGSPYNEVCSESIQAVAVQKHTAYFAQESYSVQANLGTNLDITKYPSDAEVIIESADPSIAKVDQNGNVMALAKGSTTISISIPQSGFTTTAEFSVPSISSTTDMSVFGTANCYIVPKAGTYKFKANVKGNSSEAIEDIASANVLWETYSNSKTINVGDIIQSASYSNGYVTFSTKSALTNGNALIVVKNAAKEILWSWHIWICKDYYPEDNAQSYNNNAGILMDRDLGEISDMKESQFNGGLCYQWGRKEPFSINCKTVSAENDLSERGYKLLSSANCTIENTIANPMAFVQMPVYGNGDWCPDSPSSEKRNLWDSKKTKYDPCPIGWRVPDGGRNGVWATAFGVIDFVDTSIWDSTNQVKGMNFNNYLVPDGNCWYPIKDGIDSVRPDNSRGCPNGYWSCSSPDTNNGSSLNIYSSGKVNSSYERQRATGLYVRCQKTE